MYIFMYGLYFRYHNELCYKAPISCMVVMLACCHVCHDSFSLEKVIHCKYCIEIICKDPWVVCFGFQ